MSGMFRDAKAFNQLLTFDTSTVTDMSSMFQARSSPCPAPNLHLSLPLHAACTTATRLPPTDQYRSLSKAFPPFDSRQGAWVFNQPLSFDTSSVTTMGHIRAPPARCVRGVVACRLPPADPYTSPCTAFPPFDSRQTASAFNQPLSFDTTSVTTMFYMFGVRSSPYPAPNLQPISLLCTLRAWCGRPPPPACRLVYLAPHHIPSFRLSAGRGCVQPAAELRHLQCHHHEPHVRGALLPVPCPRSAVEPSLAHCLHRGRPPPPGPHLAPHGMPSFRLSAESEGVQPAAELRHLRRHKHVADVPRALLPVPCPQSTVDLSPACYVHRDRPPPPTCRPLYLAPLHMPPFRLGRGHPPCPPSTSCRSVAHGPTHAWKRRPLALLAIARQTGFRARRRTALHRRRPRPRAPTRS
eukprot:scaffold3824_cov58-Phaeocystis_antarctica.AAC.1